MKTLYLDAKTEEVPPNFKLERRVEGQECFICGEMFTESLYHEEHPTDKKFLKIIWTNCNHFSGGNDE